MASNMELKAVITAEDKTSGVLNGVGKSLGSLATTVAKFGVAAAGAFTAAAGFAIKSASDVQMLRTNLDTLTGSAEKGSAMFQQLYDMAAKTPFETTDLVEATQMMLGYGIAQEKILPNLKMIGDVSLGNATKFQGLTYAFSQVQATGRLMGQDLLQMINNGFNPLQIISEKTGESMASLKDKMEKGAISADMVTQAFQDATAEGGRFHDGMDKGSKTLQGTLSTLKDNVMMLAREMVGLSNTGDVVEGGLFDRISDGVNNLNNVMPTVIEYFRQFKAEIINLKDKILEFFNSTNVQTVIILIRDAMLAAWQVIKDNLKPAWDELKVAIEPIMPFIKELAVVFGVMLLAALVTFIGIIAAVISFLTKLWVAIIEIFSGIIQTFQGFITFLTGIFTGDIGMAVDGVKQAFQGMKTVLEGIFNAVIGSLKSFVDSILNFFRNLYNNLIGHSIIPDLVNGIINWFISIPGRIGDALSGIANVIAQPFKDGFQAVKNFWNNTLGGKGFTMPGWAGGLSFKIPYFEKGGVMPYEGLAYLHAGERIIPAGATNNNSMSVNIYGNINNNQGLSIDEIAQSINRQVDLARLGAI